MRSDSPVSLRRRGGKSRWAEEAGRGVCSHRAGIVKGTMRPGAGSREQWAQQAGWG